MRIGFIGAGNMARAFGVAIRRSRPEAVILASDVDAERLDEFTRAVAGAQAAGGNRDVADGSDVCLLAVKPQVLPSVYPEITHVRGLVISIAAGVRLAAIEAALPEARVVRVMPNTPALVGRMAAGYSIGLRVTAGDRELVASLLSSAGVAFELPEEQLDAVTGLSGSGPAFVARLIEAFTEAGIAVGLAPEVARDLSIATFAGTAELLSASGMTPDELVRMVSSPGGTTVAGRRVLEESPLCDIIARTVRVATERSRELGA